MHVFDLCQAVIKQFELKLELQLRNRITEIFKSHLFYFGE